MDDPINLLVFTLIVGSRLIVPLWIPRFPLPAIILALVLDGIDAGAFSLFTTLPMDNYQSYDKALDIYYLTIAYLAAVRSWTNPVAVRIAAILFYYRLVGVVLSEYSENRAILLIFANIFEYFFIFYEAARLRWNMERVGLKTLIGAAAAIWIVIKLPQEYWIHIAQRDATDTLMDNPILIPILAVMIAVVVAVGYWIVTRKLPPADHAPSFAVGDSIPMGRMKEAMLRYRSLTLREQGLLEKVVLIALISSIFSMMLPGTVLTAPQLALGVSIVVVLNTIVSELLTRREMLPLHDLRHFASMVGVNMVIAATFLVILPDPEGSFRMSNMLFFFFLVSLLVTLFDRSRALAIMRDEEEHTGSMP